MCNVYRRILTVTKKTKTIEQPIITGHYFGIYSTLNSFNKEYNKIKELIHAFFYKKSKCIYKKMKLYIVLGLLTVYGKSCLILYSNL